MTTNKLPPLPERSDGKAPHDRMWDSQWDFIVNHPDVLGAIDREAAIHRAVEMAEKKMAENYRAEALRQSQSLPAGAVAGLVGKWRDIAKDGPFTVFASNRELAAYRECADELEQALQADAREKGDAVDWRDLYRFQTAMRYMDNMPDLFRDRAFAMADEDIAGIERQTLATQPAQASESMDLPQELLDRVDVLRKKAAANEGVKSQASEKDDRDREATCDDFVADYKPAGAEAVDVNKELMACPFCGEFDGEISDSSVLTINGGQKKAVYCNGCFCEGPTANTFYDAISAWNRRATHPQPVTPAVDGESFICYLIDNCEREVVHEESLHEWLADFLKNPRYHKPVTPAGGEVAMWHAFPEELGSSDTVTMYRAPCESVCLLTGKMQSTVPVITHPPVADAALARHWIERYASGVDEELQMDRVLDALGVASHD